MSQAKIRTLTDDSGIVVYPRTTIEAVFGLENISLDADIQLSDLGITATAAELNYVDGVTSNIQTQLDAKVPTSRTICGKALSSNITLKPSDVGVTISTSSPSGGSNGDIWIQYS